MQSINEIFHIEYGNQFDFSKMECTDDPSAINFISRGSTNNGFVSKVHRYKDTEPYPAGLITVTMGGSYLLASFVQPAPFYTAQNIKVLKPKYDMTLAEKLFYSVLLYNITGLDTILIHAKPIRHSILLLFHHRMRYQKTIRIYNSPHLIYLPSMFLKLTSTFIIGMIFVWVIYSILLKANV